MSFKLENFVAAPSMELLNLAKKTDLLNIANHYALISVKPSMLKHEITCYDIHVRKKTQLFRLLLSVQNLI